MTVHHDMSKRITDIPQVIEMICLGNTESGSLRRIKRIGSLKRLGIAHFTTYRLHTLVARGMDGISDLM